MQQFGKGGSSKEKLLRELAAYARNHEIPKMPFNPRFIELLSKIKAGGVRQKELSSAQAFHSDVMRKLGIVRNVRGKLIVPEKEREYASRLIENHKLSQRQEDRDRESGFIK